MNTPTQTICEFLNVTPDVLQLVNTDVLAKMEKAAEEEEFMTLHHLGYSLAIERRNG